MTRWSLGYPLLPNQKTAVGRGFVDWEDIKGPSRPFYNCEGFSNMGVECRPKHSAIPTRGGDEQNVLVRLPKQRRMWGTPDETSPACFLSIYLNSHGDLRRQISNADDHMFWRTVHSGHHTLRLSYLPFSNLLAEHQSSRRPCGTRATPSISFTVAPS